MDHLNDGFLFKNLHYGTYPWLPSVTYVFLISPYVYSTSFEVSAKSNDSVLKYLRKDPF